MQRASGIRPLLEIAALSVLLLSAACHTAALSAEEADKIIAASPNTSGLTIKTEAISRTSDTEAITHTRLGDQVLNLKFRRYDTGWRWEFAETKAGGWISADEVTKTVQEAARATRGRAWAAQKRSEYERTIEAMDRYSENIPGNVDYMNVAGWTKLREVTASLYKSKEINARFPEEERQRRLKIAESYEKPAFDAWEHEVLLHIDADEKNAVFVSIGPDGVKGSPDDVMCFAQGRPKMDGGRLIYVFTKRWTLPEGLEDVVQSTVQHAEDREGIPVKVVK